METKICSKCKEVKETKQFSKNKFAKDGLHCYCNFCRNIIHKQYRKNHPSILSKSDKKHKEKYPWRRIWNYINQRCNNINSQSYKSYGAKGIKNVFKNWDEIKFLWFRDNAYLLEMPSIDRINDNGNYELSNCRFIEFKDNSLKASIKNRKVVLQYDLQGNIINEYNSISKAAKINNLSNSYISERANGITKNSGDFIWKFKI